MKRSPNDINHTLPVKKITQSIEELLQEVNNGQYENFRAYLLQNKIVDLNVFKKDHPVDLFHLCSALQGTAVTTLNLLGNSIGDEGVEKVAIALKGTAVTTLDLSHNDIGPEGAEKLGIALQGTAINNLILSSNNIGSVGAENLGKSLNGTAVTTLNLTGNSIGANGAEKLVEALQGTAVTALDLRLNNIRNVGAALLAAFIPGTLLMTVLLDSTHKVLKQALALNERKLKQTPYTATCLTHLPENEKKQYYNLPVLGDKPSKEEEITFAGGILASLGTFKPDLQALIISYLPLMNYHGAEKLQALAQTHHGKGLQIEVEHDKNFKPKC